MNIYHELVKEARKSGDCEAVRFATLARDSAIMGAARAAGDWSRMARERLEWLAQVERDWCLV